MKFKPFYRFLLIFINLLALVSVPIESIGERKFYKGLVLGLLLGRQQAISENRGGGCQSVQPF